MIWEEHTYLLTDLNLLQTRENISMVRETAYKRPAPILRADDRALSLEGWADGLQPRLVVKDGGTYRMWYCLLPQGWSTGRHRDVPVKLGYAESRDGLRFRPVKVGQVRHDGLKRNNLVDMQGSVTHGGGMLHDPLDREYPFKCVYYRPAQGTELEPGIRARWPALAQRQYRFVWGIGRSRDGLHWEPPTHEHNLLNAGPEHARLHRALDGGMVLSDQMTHPMTEAVYRNVKGWITYDMTTAHRVPDYLFAMPEHMVRAFVEYVGPAWDRTPWVQPHVGLVCARKGPTMLALHGYLYGCTGAETFAQKADVGLAVSSTGLGFKEVWPFRPFIERGPRGDWDHGMTAQVSIIDDADQTRFYYCGNDVGNLGGTYQGGLAYIERDRYAFVCISGHRDVKSRTRVGDLSLRTCQLPAQPRFAVNVSHASARRRVRLGLADASGKPLRGYGLADCTPVTQNGVRKPVTWKAGDGTELAGRSVTISARIESEDCAFVGEDSPRLYAIYTA